jgi:hypothetical protein
MDSSQLGLHKYSGGIDHPILAFLVVGGLWRIRPGIADRVPHRWLIGIVRRLGLDG